MLIINKVLKYVGFIMRKSLFIFLLSLTVMAHALVKSEDGAQILKKNNKFYTITLPANRTTGYSWFILSYSHNVIKLVSYDYKVDNKKLLGSPGRETWKFAFTKEALIAPQIGYVKLVYVRPWELKNENALKSLTVKKIIVNSLG